MEALAGGVCNTAGGLAGVL